MWADYIVHITVCVCVLTSAHACIHALRHMKIGLCAHMYQCCSCKFLYVFACIHICLYCVICVCYVFPACIMKSQCGVSPSYVHILIFSCGHCHNVKTIDLKPLSRNMIRSPLSCHKYTGHPFSNTERAGLCNLHDVSSAFGIIYIIYAYMARIDWARLGLMDWIMGLSRSCPLSLRGPLLWWGGLKVKVRVSEATHSNSKWFLWGVVMGVAAPCIYELNLYCTWGGASGAQKREGNFLFFLPVLPIHLFTKIYLKIMFLVFLFLISGTWEGPERKEEWKQTQRLRGTWNGGEGSIEVGFTTWDIKYRAKEGEIVIIKPLQNL